MKRRKAQHWKRTLPTPAEADDFAEALNEALSEQDEFGVATIRRRFEAPTPRWGQVPEQSTLFDEGACDREPLDEIASAQTSHLRAIGEEARR